MPNHLNVAKRRLLLFLPAIAALLLAAMLVSGADQP
jgi:hypothetical protein